MVWVEIGEWNDVWMRPSCSLLVNWIHEGRKLTRLPPDIRLESASGWRKPRAHWCMVVGSKGV
jgi:hypothetical protein